MSTFQLRSSSISSCVSTPSRNDAVAGEERSGVERLWWVGGGGLSQRRGVEGGEREGQLHDRIQIGVARAEIIRHRPMLGRLKALRHPGQARGILGRKPSR